MNSFGFGGSNTHVVIDDALHYLESRSLPGNHCTVAVPSTISNKVSNGTAPVNGVAHTVNGSAAPSQQPNSLRKLLVWSANDEKAVKRTMKNYESFLTGQKTWSDPNKLDQLAFTLASRRSHMLWRTFAVMGKSGEQPAEILPYAKPIRSSTDLGLAFVFTGQGAQYVDMGRDLLEYPVFKETLKQIDDIYSSLGCEWSIFGKLDVAKTK